MAILIGKRVIDGLQATGREYTVWDERLPGFGVRVRASGTASYVFQYRAGAGRSAPVRRFTVGSVGSLTPDEARKLAGKISADVRHGEDPARAKSDDRRALTVAQLSEVFLDEHVKAKRKPRTHELYKQILDSYVVPEIGTTRATKLRRSDLVRLHLAKREAPYQANNMIRIVRSMFTFAASRGLVAEGFNPAKGIEFYKGEHRERFLSVAELERLGEAIHLAETDGLPWVVDDDMPEDRRKHVPKMAATARVRIDAHAAAALRLLIFTGCRLREILYLEWSQVDFERGLLFLADSKTGRKTVILNTPAIRVLKGLDQVGRYVIKGESESEPKTDLKRPWAAVTRHANLDGLRLHDLRHNFASFGAGGGLGLPIIGRLLGHTQPMTTARYAHLDTDPLRIASEKIAGTIAAALEGKVSGGNVVNLNQKGARK
jgi:integrase